MTDTAPGDHQLDAPPEDGDPRARIAAASAILDELAARPLEEHAPAYESLHERLQAELAEIDSA